MWGPLARLIDHAALMLIGRGQPKLLRETHAPPAEPFASRLERWKSATCELTPTETRGPVTRYQVRIEADNRSFESALYFERTRPNCRRLIVFHHGLGERPLGGSFNGMLCDRRRPIEADRIALAGLGHDEDERNLSDSLARLEGFEDLLACSVVAAKAAIDQLGESYDRRVFAGVSIGGIAALVESLYEPRFDANVAILATPFLAAMLHRSSLSHLVDRRFRLRVEYQALREKIDIDRLVGANGGRIVMINGRHDTMVDIELLRRWWVTRLEIERYEMAVSHLGGFLFGGRLRRMVSEVLRHELHRRFDALGVNA